jgi:hypothetical protein
VVVGLRRQWARVKRQSGPDFEGERPGGEYGGAEVRQGGSRAGSVAGSCGGSGAEWAERRLRAGHKTCFG